MTVLKGQKGLAFDIPEKHKEMFELAKENLLDHGVNLYQAKKLPELYDNSVL